MSLKQLFSIFSKNTSSVITEEKVIPMNTRNMEPKKINSKGLELVKHFEGWYPVAYKCPAGVWTIGYGHTKTARPGMRITEAQGDELLKMDMAESENFVQRYVKVPLNQDEFDALVAFTFNVGGGALQKSTLLSLLNQGNYDAVPAQLDRWNKAGGKVLPGLVRRRRAEGKLFSSGVLDFS
jgi:lysozyme